jgi:hypothetical protein
MANELKGKYYTKNTLSGSYQDFATKFDGLRVLAISGLDSKGKALNVYVAQWMNSQTEDFMITTNNGVIVRENVDVQVVFAISRRYASTSINEQTVYDTFIDYMTNTDVWVASRYVGKQVHCVSMDKFEPEKIKLNRGNNSYIFGKVTLHALEKPTAYT